MMQEPKDEDVMGFIRSILNMEAVCIYKTLVCIHEIARCQTTIWTDEFSPYSQEPISGLNQWVEKIMY
jgi:hypothetical protein